MSYKYNNRQKLKDLSFIFFPIILLFTSISCAHSKEIYLPSRYSPDYNFKRRNVVQFARSVIGKRVISESGKTYPNNCMGVVLYSYSKVGINFSYDNLLSDVESLYEYVLTHGKIFKKRLPNPGDIVFFHNTYDKNRDGRFNDKLTHVGIIEKIDEDGTIWFIHRTSKGIIRDALNLYKSNVYTDEKGKLYNSYIRQKKANDRKNTKYLAGQLFAGFGTIL